MSDKKIASKIAENLLEIQAVKLSPNEPFTWASGWKSPIYCDNRVTLSHSGLRKYIKKKLAEAIKNNFKGVEAIVGVATAGIPQGALVADKLDLPFAYIRPEPKDHGRKNQMEGDLKKGSKVVVIEDLISTGGSSLKAIKALRDEGFEVLGLCAIFTYGFDIAAENFMLENCKMITLSNYDTLIQKALESKYIKENDVANLEQWRKDPANWKGETPKIVAKKPIAKKAVAKKIVAKKAVAKKVVSKKTTKK